MSAEPPTYATAGVDIEAGDRAVAFIRRRAAAASRPEVLGEIGGFAGAFAPKLAGLTDPVLVSAADGVGTKLAIAQALDRHNTVGIDLVAMVADDLVCHGAEPLFVLDYIACGRLVPERIDAIVAGIAEGCRLAGCALLGGETAEHPGVMDPEAYDLAAFGVGIIERTRMLGPDRVRAGDVLIGLASSGLHSNGYSLVRRVLLDRDLDLATPVPGATLGEALLAPTRIYTPAMLALVSAVEVRALAHITGGGIPGNVARVIPAGLTASLDRRAWTEPPIFKWLRDAGAIAEQEMLRTFNLGLGMVVVVAPQAADDALGLLRAAGEFASVVGEVTAGESGVVIRE